MPALLSDLHRDLRLWTISPYVTLPASNALHAVRHKMEWKTQGEPPGRVGQELRPVLLQG